jgi:hypothetical protein
MKLDPKEAAREAARKRAAAERAEEKQKQVAGIPKVCARLQLFETLCGLSLSDAD